MKDKKELKAQINYVKLELNILENMVGNKFTSFDLLKQYKKVSTGLTDVLTHIIKK